MSAKKLPGSPEIDLDDAPELTADMLGQAEVFDGDNFVRRGRGRPPLDAPKEKVNVRLDRAVLERLRASGPGWQTRVNAGMAMLTGVDRRIWDWIDSSIAETEKEIESLKYYVELMEAGAMRTIINDKDTTKQSLTQNKDGIKQRTDAIRTMRETQIDLLGPFTVEAHSPAATHVDAATLEA